MKYVRSLAKVDDNVMSVSPQQNKENRPFVGIVVICDDKQYCVPLSSPKQKHLFMNNDKDFTKIYDKDKIIGVLNFNNMIPVTETLVQHIKMGISHNESIADIHYKKMLAKQLDWCQKHQSDITNKANTLYNIVTQRKCSNNLLKRCCNFARLEQVLDKYISKSKNTEEQSVKQQQKENYSPLSRNVIKKNAKIISSKNTEQQTALKNNTSNYYYLKVSYDEAQYLEKQGIPFEGTIQENKLNVIRIDIRDREQAENILLYIHNNNIKK